MGNKDNKSIAGQHKNIALSLGMHGLGFINKYKYLHCAKLLF